MLKPILFLDIDGVLWTYSDLCPIAGPAEGLKELWPWARKNFEIYWLTAWAVNRTEMPKDVAIRLWKYTGLPVNETIDCPVAPWLYYKSEGVEAVIGDSDRQWLWLEDELMLEEIEWLVNTNNRWRHIFCNVFRDKDSLVEATRILKFALDKLVAEE